MHTNKQKEKQTKAQTFEQSQKLKTAQSVSDEGGVAQQTMLPNTNSEPKINISNNRDVPIILSES